MNYIYDILINFNEKLYNFFEWNLNDNIEHIRKVPIFKVNSYTINDIRNNNVIFKNEFKNKILNKTEIFTSKDIKKIDYAFLLSDGMEVIGIKIENDKILKSELLVDEDIEVLEFCSNLEQTEIEYEIKNKINFNPFKTRKQFERKKFVMDNIKILNKENNINKLVYLYYECFNEKETNKEKILKRLNNELENEKLYKIFKLVQISK